eukprot:4327229-Amphidinium_carterae.2
MIFVGSVLSELTREQSTATTPIGANIEETFEYGSAMFLLSQPWILHEQINRIKDGLSEMRLKFLNAGLKGTVHSATLRRCS